VKDGGKAQGLVLVRGEPARALLTLALVVSGEHVPAARPHHLTSLGDGLGVDAELFSLGAQEGIVMVHRTSLWG
jgi:hypothetical protein